VNGRAYKVMLYVGCVLGVYAGAAVADGKGLDPSRFALVTIALLIPAFAGARAWFVVRHGPVSRLLDRSQGGAGLFGGLVVAIVVSIPTLHLAKLPFWTFWDAAIITMLVGLIFTRFGCQMNGCCAGRPTNSRLGMVLPDVTGTRRRRYPTQLLEAGFAALVLVVAVAVHNRVNDGAVFAGVVGLYCVARSVLQPLREDRAPVNASNVVGVH
jgi:phosphatidylglycerol---prolipoprotein diacylglyceryl transferase